MKAAVKRELDRLAANGPLSNRKVIEAARDPKSPLHSFFTWDKNKALELNLVNEARELMADYTVIVRNAKGETIECRAFVSLTTERGLLGGYRTIESVMNDAQLYQQLLDDALRELQSFQVRYSTLKQLRPIFRQIEKVRKKPPKSGKKR